MDDLVLRATARQRRGLLKGAGISFVIGAATVGLWAVLPSGNKVLEYTMGAAFGVVLFLAVYAFTARDATELTAAGLRNRNLGRRRTLTWDEIADIRVRTTRGRISTAASVVVVTPVKGRRFTLAAPVDGGAMVDPDFKKKYREIRARWRTYAPARYRATLPGGSVPPGRTRPDS